MAAVSPPPLGPRGAALWRSLTGEYEPTDAELAVIGEVCRTVDVLDDLAAVVASDGVTVAGSMGQRVVHPGVGEARQQRVTLTRLLKSLGLDEDAVTVAAAPAVNRERASFAARTRWAREKGVGA